MVSEFDVTYAAKVTFTVPAKNRTEARLKVKALIEQMECDVVGSIRGAGGAFEVDLKETSDGVRDAQPDREVPARRAPRRKSR